MSEPMDAYQVLIRTKVVSLNVNSQLNREYFGIREFAEDFPMSIIYTFKGKVICLCTIFPTSEYKTKCYFTSLEAKEDCSICSAIYFFIHLPHPCFWNISQGIHHEFQSPIKQWDKVVLVRGRQTAGMSKSFVCWIIKYCPHNRVIARRAFSWPRERLEEPQQKFAHWKAEKVQNAREGSRDADEDYLKLIVASIKRDHRNKEESDREHKL